MSQRNDVVILGGGLAGLTLALQLKGVRPETSILVAEKRAEPAPEATFKVGESTVEIGAYYYSDVVGLRDHLDAEQYDKFGLRFFLPAGGNEDITRRVEWSSVWTEAGVKSYQIDRGRLENHLMERASGAGVEVLRGARVQEIELADGDADHTVTLEQEGATTSVSGRWVVDAAGRAFLLKQKLGLAKDNGHHVNSSWFRLDGGLDLERWGADDADWMAKAPEPGKRMFSTNHLMGRGYWVWLIPLRSGPISIGICADANIHPWEEIDTLDGALDWLGRHEPQLAAEVSARRDQILDFLKVKDFSYDCEHVFSRDRWLLTGEAGRFADPLYSPGSNFIGYSNCFITEIVTTDLAGEDAGGLVDAFDFLHGTLFNAVIALYRDQYEVMGAPQQMLAKLTFDALVAAAIAIPLFVHGKMTDLGFFGQIAPIMSKLGPLTGRVQELLREWARRDPSECEGVSFVFERFKPPGVRAEDLVEPWDDERLLKQFQENARLIEALAVAIMKHAADRLGIEEIHDGTPINPYAIGLERSRWEEDGLFGGEDAISPQDASALVGDLEEALWIDSAPARS
jgi:flavin-dependent dehydrogenase